MLPLLQAKFQPPLAESLLVSRERLSQRFRDGQWRKLTLITAPPGYGKTSLMAQIYRQMGQASQTVVWLSLESSERDYGQLIRHLVAAIRCVHDGFGESVGVLLQGGVNLPPDAVTRVLANELSGLKEPLFVFLEDLHELDAETQSGVVRQLINGTPPHIRFVISSRSLCELGTGRLRATGQLEEITWEALRFNSDEVREYFSRANKLDLDESLAHVVLQKTEGWAAALQLTSLALRDNQMLPDLLERMDSGEQGVAAYLAEDVLRHLSDELRTFLLAVAPLRRVCASLCNAVTGDSDAAAKLRHTESANIFISATDSERRWYRFHPLFSGFVTRQLDPAVLNGILLRAAEWFVAERRFDDAVELALRAGALEFAGQLLNVHAYDLWRSGHQSRLDGWARQIPPALRCRFPRFRLVQAWSLTLAGKVSASIKILDEVRAQYPDGVVPESEGRDLLFMQLMIAYYREDLANTEALCEAWLKDNLAPDPFLLGAVKSVLAGTRGLQFDLEYGLAEIGHITDLFEESGTPYGPIWSLTILGALQLGAGRLEPAMALIQQALDFAIRIGGASTPLAALPASLLAHAHYERNETLLAQALLDLHCVVPERLNFADHEISAFLVPARLRAGAGEIDAALDLLEAHARRTGSDVHRSLRIRAHWVHEKIRLLEVQKKTSRIGLLAKMEGLDGHPEAHAPSTHGSALGAIKAQARLRVALAGNDATSALGLARHWIRFSRERKLPRPEVLFRLLHAQLLLMLGQNSAARRELREAMLVAAPQGLVRAFLDEDARIRPLLSQIGESLRTTAPELEGFLGLLQAALSKAAGSGPDAGKGPQAAASERLSPREQEVLRLVAQGLSNREIGMALGLTENTVKWNLRQMFQKLAVRRRSQAIRIGREVGLIA